MIVTNGFFPHVFDWKKQNIIICSHVILEGMKHGISIDDAR